MFDLKGTEESKEIEGFPNYWVTSLGRVISGPHRTRSGYRELAPRPGRGGYLYVNLYNIRRVTKKIHVLVADAFLPNPNNFPTVNHKNGKEKWNNRVDNLEWATQQEQVEHSLSTGLRPLNEDWGISDESKYKKLTKPYKVQFRINGERKSLGSYITREEAREIRDRYCRDHNMLRPISEGS